MKQLLFITLALCFTFLPASAEDLKHHVEETIEHDLNSDGRNEIIERIFVVENITLLPDTWMIRVKSGDKTYQSKPVVKGPSYSGASLEIIQITEKQPPVIVLWYGAGAYSYGAEVFRFDNKLEQINHFYCDGLVFCDYPATVPITFEDIDSDGILEVKVISRDWDHESTTDKVIEVYKYDGDNFKLYSTEQTKTGKVTMNIKLPQNKGAI